MVLARAKVLRRMDPSDPSTMGAKTYTKMSARETEWVWDPAMRTEKPAKQRALTWDGDLLERRFRNR